LFLIPRPVNDLPELEPPPPPEEEEEDDFSGRQPPFIMPDIPDMVGEARAQCRACDEDAG
jgi:hypothetical protein